MAAYRAMSTRISIVTPSYNQARFLERTLQSVIRQRDHVHEYFVLDGGSTDGSQDIIRRHEQHVDYWQSEKDDGQSDAIHTGFQRCTGDVLYWLNSDDVLLPGILERVTQQFDAEPELDVLSGWAVWIDENDRIMRLHITPVDSPAWMRWGTLRLHQPTCFFKRALYEEVGGLDLSLHCMMDTDLWYKFARTTRRWAGMHDYVAGHRIHAETKGLTLLPEYRIEREQVKAKYPEFTRNKLKSNLGRMAWYIAQLTSGNAARRIRDGRHMLGQTLDEVFPPVEPIAPAAVH